MVIFIDNILMYLKDRKEHEGHLRTTLATLWREKLYTKLSNFWFEEIKFLGHVVSKVGVSVNPGNIKVVKEWLTSKNVSQVRSFLGVAG